MKFWTGAEELWMEAVRERGPTAISECMLEKLRHDSHQSHVKKYKQLMNT